MAASRVIYSWQEFSSSSCGPVHRLYVNDVRPADWRATPWRLSGPGELAANPVLRGSTGSTDLNSLSASIEMVTPLTTTIRASSESIMLRAAVSGVDAGNGYRHADRIPLRLRESRPS